ncbi:hypothetical protein EBT31_10265 [bacterium]|nr:hypothetical protein [bacterium]
MDDAAQFEAIGRAVALCLAEYGAVVVTLSDTGLRILPGKGIVDTTELLASLVASGAQDPELTEIDRRLNGEDRTVGA